MLFIGWALLVYHRQCCCIHTYYDHLMQLCLSRENTKAVYLYCSGYEAAYKQKLRGKTDGCATFYKQAKFNCCNCIPVEFSVDGCSVLDRANVALLMLLEPVVNSHDGRQARGGSTRVCVANTHLLYNPRRGDVKLAQLMFLFAAIDEVAAISAQPCPDYVPVILCGDLNLEPFSSLYDFIVSGIIHYEGLPIKAMSGQNYDDTGRRLTSQHFLPPSVDVTDYCQFFQVAEHRHSVSRCSRRWRSYEESFCSGVAHHALNLMSAYDDARPQALTSWLGDRSCGARVDYIFYSAGQYNSAKFGHNRRMAEGLLTLSHVLQLPTEEQVCQSGGLPNNKQSSDHLMLMAWFILNI